MNFRLHLAALLAGIFGASLAASASPVTAILRLQEKVPMAHLAEAVKSSMSPMVRGYTNDEIRAISAPADADYDALIEQLRNEGFTINMESPTHLWVGIQADSTVFERVFATRLEMNEKMERHAVVAPTTPSHLGLIAAIDGLNSTRHAHPKYKKQSSLGDNPSGISRADIAKIYHFDTVWAKGINGTGQHIAIATYMGFNIPDVQYFYKYQKLSPMSTVDQVTFNGTPAVDEDSAMETQLDAEFSGMMAPGAAVHVFASATNDDAGETAIFTAILDDGRAKVANYSWGSCETQTDPKHAAEVDKLYQRAVAQGVNIMVASGDSGSDGCQNNTTAADWPGADANIVAVGGTTLLNNNNVYTEQGWNGSGGGISSIWALPAYQNGIGAQFTKRTYPDVSFNADPASGEPVYVHQNGAAGWMQIGGTSMAAPQWAGLMALVENARKSAGKPSLGFLNPTIYGMTSAARKSVINDITFGNNGAYNAGPGYDAVTGWGSPNAAALVSALVAH